LRDAGELAGCSRSRSSACWSAPTAPTTSSPSRREDPGRQPRHPRRHRAGSSRNRRHRRPLPPRRCRRRETLHRRQRQPAPRRPRRDQAQDPAAAMVDRLLRHAHRRRTSDNTVRLAQTPTAKASDPSADQNRAESVAVTGRIRWPPSGRFRDRHRAHLDGP
jgi:hypothetical protein